MKINIKDKEIELKKTFRSYVIYESITDKIFAPKTMSDIINYFYSVVLDSYKDMNITFDEFIDWLDENENALNDFEQWLTKINEVDSKLQSKKKEKKTKKKKSRASRKYSR